MCEFVDDSKVPYHAIVYSLFVFSHPILDIVEENCRMTNMMVGVEMKY